MSDVSKILFLGGREQASREKKKTLSKYLLISFAVGRSAPPALTFYKNTYSSPLYIHSCRLRR